MKASEVRTALLRRYGCLTDNLGPEWAALPEFTLAPGFSAKERIDLFLVRAWSGKPKRHERHAIEIKVSRADFRAEMAKPWKRAPFEAVAHRFYFAAPAGLIDPNELPAGIGLIEVTENGTTERVRAKRREDPDPMPESSFVEAFRRASRAEARIRQSTIDDPAAKIAELEAQIKSLERQLQTSNIALHHEKSRVKNLVLHVANVVETPCTCGNGLLKPRRVSRQQGGVQWGHVEADVECQWSYPDADRVEIPEQ